MPDNIYTVYKITNKVNQKIYIGFTEKRVEIRFKQHCKKSSKAKYRLYYAIQKYGSENFLIEELYQSKEKEDALDKEIHFIDKFQSHLTENGYNMRMGGNVGEATPETRRKMSESLRRVPRTQEWINNLRNSIGFGEDHHCYGRTGEKHPMFGKTHSEEVKQKLSKRFSGEGNPMHGVTHSPELIEQIVLRRRSKNPVYRQEVVDKIYELREQGLGYRLIGREIEPLIGKKGDGTIAHYVKVIYRDKLATDMNPDAV